MLFWSHCRYTLKLASPLSIKPLTLEAILPSHLAAVLPPASILLPIFQPVLPFSASATPLQQSTQRADPLAGGYVSLCSPFSHKLRAKGTEIA